MNGLRFWCLMVNGLIEKNNNIMNMRKNATKKVCYCIDLLRVVSSRKPAKYSGILRTGDQNMLIRLFPLLGNRFSCMWTTLIMHLRY